MKTNVLYYGDNLDILRNHIADESIDLIYLDPPFNSNRSYNVLFRETTGEASAAQIEAFEDTWNWAGAAPTYDEVMTGPHQDVARMVKAMVDGLGHNDVTAYLSMMAIRLVELRRVLKPIGSIYLHCDPTTGHYLKVLMDGVFGPPIRFTPTIRVLEGAHACPHRNPKTSASSSFRPSRPATSTPSSLSTSPAPACPTSRAKSARAPTPSAGKWPPSSF
jgi:hypothetical protein